MLERQADLIMPFICDWPYQSYQNPFYTKKSMNIFFKQNLFYLQNIKKLCCLYFYSRQLKQNLLTVFSKVSYKTYLFYWIKLLFFCHLWCYIEDIWKIDWCWERREMIIIHEPSPFLHIFHCSSHLCIRIVLYCITEQNVLHVFFSFSVTFFLHLISPNFSLSLTLTHKHHPPSKALSPADSHIIVSKMLQESSWF